MNRRIDETLLLGRAGQVQTGEKSTSLRTRTSVMRRLVPGLVWSMVHRVEGR